MSGKTCNVPNCDKPVFMKGLCCSHYNRWRDHGDPLGGGTARGARKKFIEQVVANPPDYCVLFPFTPSSGGYGQFMEGGKTIKAHRYAYELYTGEKIPEGMEVAHAPVICHNRLCVNPKHLRAATRAENQADKYVDGTAHRGEQINRTKLTPEQVREIRKIEGMTHREMGKKYGVDGTTIGLILRGKTWGWLK